MPEDYITHTKEQLGDFLEKVDEVMVFATHMSVTGEKAGVWLGTKPTPEMLAAVASVLRNKPEVKKFMELAMQAANEFSM